eukprot:1363359-Prymnesium_polylepis.1
MAFTCARTGDPRPPDAQFASGSPPAATNASTMPQEPFGLPPSPSIDPIFSPPVHGPSPAAVGPFPAAHGPPAGPA